MKLYNTMTRELEDFRTLETNKVKMYNCGLTVYSQPHIGNWVGYIYWDVLTRTLEYLGYEVDRVQNITDVGHLVSDDDNGEDKMEKGAKAEGLTAWQVAEKYIEIADHEAYDLLGLRKPKLVRATDLIDKQIEFVKKLEDKDYTYVIPDEGVYFDTSKLKDYGKLARIDSEGLKAGERVEFKNKKNKTDFALWKFSPKDSRRDMEWDSPWGIGFPGWHLECSVIAYENLGEQIDIHTGGIDHIPIHHTNEIAQTESLTNKTFSNFWVHNNHLKVDGSKMAKSLGNIYTLKDISEKGYSIVAFKLMILSKNYHTEGNFTWDILEASQNRLNNWQAVADMQWQLPEAEPLDKEELIKTLEDNINTPNTLKIIDEYFELISSKSLSPNKGTLKLINQLLGIDLMKPDIDASLKDLISTRQKAKSEKDYKKADEIRETLLQKGIGINDTPNGQIWYRA